MSIKLNISINNVCGQKAEFVVLNGQYIHKILYLQRKWHGHYI